MPPVMFNFKETALRLYLTASKTSLSWGQHSFLSCLVRCQPLSTGGAAVIYLQPPLHTCLGLPGLPKSISYTWVPHPLSPKPTHPAHSAPRPPPPGPQGHQEHLGSPSSSPTLWLSWLPMKTPHSATLCWRDVRGHGRRVFWKRRRRKSQCREIESETTRMDIKGQTERGGRSFQKGRRGPDHAMQGHLHRLQSARNRESGGGGSQAEE